jgi:carbonic anhydrase
VAEAIDNALRANEAYARDFRHGDLGAKPQRKLAVVTCMDCRLEPLRFLGLEPGDAHVIANAGGRAKEALRSLVVSQQMLGTEEVAVIHHTECGMGAHTNDEIRERVRETTGADTADVDFLPFGDLEESVREDVAFLRDSPLIPDSVTIRGFVYDVRSGRVSEVA